MSKLNAGAFEFVPGRAFVFAQQGAGQVPEPPPPIERPPQTEAPAPPPTITLNIGGSKPPTTSAGTPAPAAPAPPAAVARPSVASTGTTPAQPHPVSKPASSTPQTSNKVFTTAKAKTDTSSIVQEVRAVADQEVLKDLYGDVKEHLNIVFVGHVDAGKSTLGGNLLYITGAVDKRTMEKYEREAKDAGRETWYLSWALDSTPQERSKGKTVEVGRAYFETDNRRYTVLDAPGHKTYVPSMISGAAQADVAILVISARKGEFETGFERGGQTREHIMLVKTVGVSKIVAVVNKMDDPTVGWDQARFNEIKEKITPFIRAAGFNPKTDVTFIPVSAFTGLNLRDRVPKSTCPWWSGSSLLEHLDHMPMVDRKINGPLMMPVSEKYKDLGTIVVGKIESGHMRRGDTLLLMPNKDTVEVAAIYDEQEAEIPSAICGDNVRIRLRGVEDDDISPGFVLTSPKNPVHSVRQFEAQLAILEHKNIICAGYSAVMHVHTLADEVTLTALLHYFDKATGRKSRKPPQFAKKGQKIVALIETALPVCVERPNTPLSESQVAELPSPPTSWLSARDMKIFGAQPLRSDIGVVRCVECDKPVLRSAISDHATNCNDIRSGKKWVKSKTADGEVELKKGKKRSADGEEVDELSEPSKKKAKVAKGRAKGPVDYDKHCGVINDKGLPCSRALTCKAHSMGAKRAVQGRSKPYDELLLEWNRANNPNWVEPVKKETKAEKKEKREKEKAEKKRMAMEAAIASGLDPKAAGAKKAVKKPAVSTAQHRLEGDDGAENLDDLDSEAEVDALVKAVQIAQTRGVIGVPLAVPTSESSWRVMVHVRINEKEANPNPYINFITVLPIGDATVEEEARQLLRALAAQVKPIMKAHGFTYEFNRIFSGRNWNNGETIELVLRGANGSLLPVHWLMSTLCHELAHIKHMNHGPAFQALWQQLRQQVRTLQGQGYHGDGYWSSGRRLADSAKVAGQGIEMGDLPEYMVIYVMNPSDTAKNRKAGSRVTSTSAFRSVGKALNEGLDDHMKVIGTGFRKKAGSKRAREERALAAEKRLQAGSSTLEDSDSEGGRFDAETDQDRRQALLESVDDQDLKLLEVQTYDFSDDFLIPKETPDSRCPGDYTAKDLGFGVTPTRKRSLDNMAISAPHKRRKTFPNENP
ncbi:hypothetical protein ID866_1718, partial [Astraeus odoratus]